MTSVSPNRKSPRVHTVSANEAKQRWGAMMTSVNEGDRVIVESHGKPKVAVISVEDLQRLEALEERERREGALRWLQDFEAGYDGRNDDLTEAQIEELADRAAHEIFDELAAEGKLNFERDPHKP
jgi:prevent-host-death family protein